ITMNQMCTVYMIIMQCAEFGDLSQFRVAYAEYLTWPLRKRISLDVATALNHMHSANICHEDIKSHNVLIDIKLRASLCDFGCTRHKDEPLIPAITEEYASPEKIEQFDEWGDDYDAM